MDRARWLGVLGALTLISAGPAAAKDEPGREHVQPVTKRPENLETAVATPAEDLNIRKTEIPEVLQRAVVNPYDMRSMDRCGTVGAELIRLNDALGPDGDAPPPPDTRTKNQKRQNTAASVLRTGVEAVTPYRGVIRRITGATATQRRLQEAIDAGFTRRGFLKGVGMKLNCAPPAAPAWFRPEAAPSRQVMRPVAPAARPKPRQPARKP